MNRKHRPVQVRCPTDPSLLYRVRAASFRKYGASETARKDKRHRANQYQQRKYDHAEGYRATGPENVLESPSGLIAGELSPRPVLGRGGQTWLKSAKNQLSTRCHRETCSNGFDISASDSSFFY